VIVFRRAFLLSLLVSAFLAPIIAQAQLEFPKSKGWVNDFAGVLDINMTKRLALICAEVDQKTHAQIAVVTIKYEDPVAAAVEVHAHSRIGRKVPEPGAVQV
jgi:uncharacterized membrane protein YgcG